MADWPPSLIVSLTVSSLPLAFLGMVNASRATLFVNCSACRITLPWIEGSQIIVPLVSGFALSLLATLKLTATPA